MEILGLITARGGSKSIPNKNIVTVAGKPLIFYTCNAAKKSKKLTRVILSTDDPKIADCVKKYGVEVPFMRPAELAKDEIGSLPVIEHALSFLLEKEKYVPDVIVLLQPTSPLRKAKHIDDAVDLLAKTGADSVVSVVEVPHNFNPVSVMKLEKGKLIPFLQGPQILRRQDKPKVYSRNGPAVLAMRRDTVVKDKSLYGENIVPLIMRQEESVDIDSEFDLKIAKYLLECGGDL